jgi:hypothetical protein
LTPGKRRPDGAVEEIVLYLMSSRRVMDVDEEP